MSSGVCPLGFLQPTRPLRIWVTVWSLEFWYLLGLWETSSTIKVSAKVVGCDMELSGGANLGAVGVGVTLENFIWL